MSLSHLCSSEISYPNSISRSTYQIWNKLLQPILRYKWVKFCCRFFVFCFILHTSIFCYKAQMHVPIKLKLGTHKGLAKVHLCTNFGGNSLGIHGVIKNYSHKIKSKARHTYRVNRLQEWVEVHKWSNYRSSAFCDLKWLKATEIWNQTRSLAKITPSIFVNKKIY